ncbi:MAG: hypothetical protein KIT84_15660 [Labilithrix sp.]|nr:hypothetical protein [Labilithrix sp.]MCW5812463.1 hypothetical protein [Labilithrix sp.]
MRAHLLVVASLLGCSGGPSTALSSEDGPSSSSSGQVGAATAQAIFTGRFEDPDAGACSDAGALAEVGAFGEPSAAVPSTPAPNGSTWSGKLVSVTCAVREVADEKYDVSAALRVGDDQTVRIEGRLEGTGDSKDVRVVVERPTGAWEDRTCVARLTEPNMGVASGRAWAEIRCPKLEQGEATCALTAQVRLENCTH